MISSATWDGEFENDEHTREAVVSVKVGQKVHDWRKPLNQTMILAI